MWNPYRRVPALVHVTEKGALKVETPVTGLMKVTLASL